MTMQAARFAGARRWQKIKLSWLEKQGYVPRNDLARGSESMLIVGSGPSARRDDLAQIASGYDFVVTMNEARHFLDRADVKTYEFCYWDQSIFERQLAGFPDIDLDRALIKPFSILRMPKANIAMLRQAWEKNSDTAPAFLDHRYLPPPLAYAKPQLLMSRNRPLLQSRGTLSALLDAAWLGEVSHVGLIGTDLGHVDDSGQFVPHPTDLPENGVPGIAGMLEKFRSVGYLRSVEFTHYHVNERLRDVL